MKPMKPMKPSALPASVVAALILSACGGGGGGMVAAKPDAPAAAVPVQAPETEPGGESEPVVRPDVPELPDPATLLRSHDRLGLADGFTAIEADEAMFVLANMPYYARQPGGAGLAFQSLRSIAGDGTFGKVGTYDHFTDGHGVIPPSIRGAFYGPGGIEAAGVFNAGVRTDNPATGVHGAFGVRKPDEP